MAVADKSERALARMLSWTRGFPNPRSGQAAKAAPVLEVMRKLEPLAEKIASSKVGTPKGTLREGGLGYFGGSATLTQAEVDNAKSLLIEIRTTLPAYTGVLEDWHLQKLKGESQRLLMTATDMEVDETVGDVVAAKWTGYLDLIADVWSGVVDVVVDLPDIIKQGMTFSPAAWALGRGAGDSIMPYVIGGLGVVGLVAVVLLRK